MDSSPYKPAYLMDNNDPRKKEKKVEPVVKEAPKIREKTFKEKLKEEINPARDIKEIADHIVFKIIIPSFKYNFRESIFNLVDMFLFPQGVNPTRSVRPSSGPVYREYYDRNNPTSANRYPAQRIRNDVFRYEDYEGFETIEEAEKVLNGMWDILNNSEGRVVTVGEYYQLRAIPTNQTDFNYGWTNLNSVQPMQDFNDGKWYLVLPKPMALR